MYFLQRRQSHPSFHAQLPHPALLACMLEHHQEETMKCAPPSPSKQRAGCRMRLSGSSGGYFHMVDQTDRFLMYTDLPGVKLEDLKVEISADGDLHIQGERNSGKTSYPINRKMVVDDKLIDPSKITATLTHGVLEIAAPKKQPVEPRRVAVITSVPASADDNDDINETYLSFDVDVPGVRLQDLKVEIDDDKLSISGERTRGGQTTSVGRAFAINTKTIDTSMLEGFLEDGVLTVRVPTKEPVAIRDIPVNSTTNDKQDKENDGEKNQTDDKDEPELTSAEEEDDEGYYDADTVVETFAGSGADATEEADDAPTSASSDELEFEVVPETVTEDDE